VEAEGDLAALGKRGLGRPSANTSAVYERPVLVPLAWRTKKVAPHRLPAPRRASCARIHRDVLGPQWRRRPNAT